MGCNSSRSATEAVTKPTPPVSKEPAPSTPNQIRVLCLHGFRTSTSVMKVQVADFLHAFDPSEVHVTFLNAPYPASGPAYDDVGEFFGKDGPYYEWWNVDDSKYGGWKKSLEYLQEQVQARGPFDVIVGFSQGATMATLLAVHYQAQGVIPFKAVVLVCGLVPIDGMPSDVIEINMPSIHVLGESDPVFDLGQALVDIYASTPSRHVFKHPDGHKFPAATHSKGIFDQVATILRTLCPKPE
ncbi:hypothetical protein LEN26_010452 [Aphanomyces euteiches]|nr:hypothetical protein AeMF1_014863 [Aphanomyces euteiches]KAH9121938.1 hypothetical protein LEN26_010452 [Aphanomyces euteiches]KAH9187930.1 hypothetical protein AeNC1_010098 [Aphanomyces euteiches]